MEIKSLKENRYLNFGYLNLSKEKREYLKNHGMIGDGMDANKEKHQEHSAKD